MWPSADMSSNENPILVRTCETVLKRTLGQVPVVGELLDALVDVFWPEADDRVDVWATIESQVNAAIANAISAQHFIDLHDMLEGLKRVLDKLTPQLQNPLATTEDTYVSLTVLFEADAPAFQGQNSDDLTAAGDIRLLPLFAPFALLQLALLGEGALHGAGFGLGDAVPLQQADLSRLVKQYQQFVCNTVASGWTDGSDPLQADTPAALVGNAAQLPAQGWLAFNNNVLSARGYAYYWTYMDCDPRRYPFGMPPGTTTAPTQLFLGVAGQGTNFTAAGMDVYDWNTQGPISRIGLWFGETVSGNTDGSPASQLLRVQVHYGQARAPAMGPNYDGSELSRVTVASGLGLGNRNLTYKEIVVAPDNPVVAVRVSYYYTVYALAFVFKDGTVISADARETAADQLLPSTYSPTPVGGTPYLNANVEFAVSQPTVSFDPDTGKVQPTGTRTAWVLSSIVVNQSVGLVPSQAGNMNTAGACDYTGPDYDACRSSIATAALNPSGLILGFRDPASYPSQASPHDLVGNLTAWAGAGEMTFDDNGDTWPLHLRITRVTLADGTVVGAFSVNDPALLTGWERHSQYAPLMYSIGGSWGGQLTGTTGPAPAAAAPPPLTTGPDATPFGITELAGKDDASQWPNVYTSNGGVVRAWRWQLDQCNAATMGGTFTDQFNGRTGRWTVTAVLAPYAAAT
jgi:hypothetical protein